MSRDEREFIAFLSTSFLRNEVLIKIKFCGKILAFVSRMPTISIRAETFSAIKDKLAEDFSKYFSTKTHCFGSPRSEKLESVLMGGIWG